MRGLGPTTAGCVGARVAAGAVVVLALAGCAVGGASSTPGTPPGHTSSTATGRASFQPSPADFRRIQALLHRRATAVLHHDRAAYLATVDPRQQTLLTQQQTLFANLAQLPITHLSYAVDTSAALVPAPVPGHDPVLHPTVVEHLRLAGTFRRPVSNQVEETFVRRGGTWLLGAESQATDRTSFDSPQERPWFGVPVVARHTGDMTVVVDRSQAASLPGLARAVRDDIGYDARLLGVPASYRILVDATTNGLSFDFSALSREEAAAVTFGMAGTDALGTTGTGLAGMVIKVNPHTVDQVVDDEGIMRHELTHYLLHRYSGSVPKWLSEGTATWVQYQPDDFSRLQVSPGLYDRLMRADHRLPILGLFNEDPDVNYPVSQAAVTWLVTHYGVPKLLDLMAAYRRAYAGVDVDALTPRLLRQVYGVSPAQVTTGAWQLLAEFQH
jgi:hypothetical protein